MSSNRMVRRGVSMALLALSVLLASACSQGVKRPASTAVAAPAAEQAGGPTGEQEQAAPPTFQKVRPEDNSSLVPAEPAVGPVVRSPYHLEVEDQLDISVYGETDLQHVEVPVRPDGMISFAFIGDVMAAGRTIEEVRQEMEQRMGKFLRSPQVTVIAKQFAQKKVYIGGEVKTPQVLLLGGREATLLDALYKAGLTTDKGDIEGAYLMRGNKVVDANFKSLVRGDVSSNVRLMDQDVIFVPENTRRYVYVLGEVRTPTALETQEPIPIIRALAQAGWMQLGAKVRGVAVVRGGLRAPEIAVVDAKALVHGDMKQNIMVEPGDIVYVSRGALGNFNLIIEEVLRFISPFVQGVVVSNTVNP